LTDYLGEFIYNFRHIWADYTTTHRLKKYSKSSFAQLDQLYHPGSGHSADAAITVAGTEQSPLRGSWYAPALKTDSIY